MDAVTHALVGASVAQWLPSRLALRDRIVLGAGAAVLPDIDFALFRLDPLRFLVDWHQGPTHSLVLLPLWAALVGGACARLMRVPMRDAMLLTALAILSHVAVDLVTAYGTALFAPLSDRRYALSIAYVIDPIATLLVALGLGASLLLAWRGMAALGLVALAGYFALLWVAQQRALEVARGMPAERVVALAQPLAPVHWKLIVNHGGGQREAHLRLFALPPLPWPGLLGELAASYVPADRLVWRETPLLGATETERALAEPLWNHPRFEAFRRFATHPALSSVRERGSETCVWFSDRRYDLPALPDTFRFGFCRPDAQSPWSAYRLRYFSADAREPLD